MQASEFSPSHQAIASEVLEAVGKISKATNPLREFKSPREIRLRGSELEEAVLD